MVRKLFLVTVLVFGSAALMWAHGSQEKSSTQSTAAASQSSTAIASSGTLPKGNWVIALSNSYYGNTWRKQMVNAFTAAAKVAKREGLIKNYIILNGDGTQNTQIAQVNSLILKGVNAIAMDSASPTALNGVIAKAHQAGIKVLAFDSIATSPYAKKLDFNFIKDGEQDAAYIAKRLHGHGNVLQILGISGSAPSELMAKGQDEELAKYPGIHIVGKVIGQATASVTENAVANILPSLPKVDGVMTQGGGDAYGVVKAFEASSRPMPIIVSGNTSEFIHWWIKEKQKTGYKTVGICSTPGIGGPAFWVTLAWLDGVKIPNHLKMSLVTVTNSDVNQFASLKPGTIVSPNFTYKQVLSKIIRPAG